MLGPRCRCCTPTPASPWRLASQPLAWALGTTAGAPLWPFLVFEGVGGGWGAWQVLLGARGWRGGGASEPVAAGG